MLNRVSLNTIGLNRIGLNRIGKPSRASSDRPYIDPEVLASLKAVCICYGKSNDDPDRAVVKNLVDPDNPFVISNAAYTEGSGYADKGSPYYGAFVTDGINDLITSTNTVQEMLGGSNEITVVSMWANLGDTLNTVNTIRGNVPGYCQNIATSNSINNKYYIAGYSGNVNSNITMITPLLGDKADWIVRTAPDWVNSNFSVEGFRNSAGSPSEVSKVAWYWTIIANKVLTTDEINQVISYFNLDKTLKPDILCDVKKQGISNENHAEFGDKLIDFSGNGRDIQLNNIAWKGDSGIGKYEVDFASLNYNNTTSVFTATYKSCSISKIIKDGVGNIFYNWGQTLATINSTKIQVIGLDEIGAILEFTYLDESGNSTTKQYSTDGIYDLPASAAYQGDSHNTNFRFSIRGYIGDCDITITQIPSHAGALCLDGINDFGKVTGMPVYKDFTVIANRRFIGAHTGAVISKSYAGNSGAFYFESGSSVASFGLITSLAVKEDIDISYLSKYVYKGDDIQSGTAVDSDEMWLGILRDNDPLFSNIAIYSLMSFPYSMSEFLIERQLKKHKLGTLYPDMVEFRPIVKSNLPYSSITYSVNPGEYISVDSMVTITVTFPNTSDKLMEVSCNAISDISISGDNGVYEITGKIVKSPQKINLVISSYLTMLNNETLISNETLIKNE